MSGVAGDDKDDTYMGHIKEDSGEDEAWHDWKNEHADDDHIKEIEHHLRSLKDDRDYEREGSEYDDDDYEDDRKDESRRRIKEGGSGRKLKDRGQNSPRDEMPDRRKLTEDSGEEEAWHDWKNEHADDDHIKEIEHHLRALKDDRDYEEDHEELEENNPTGSLAASQKAGDDSDPIDAMLEHQVKRVLKKNKKLKLRFK